MSLKLYNSLTHKKEVFVPINESEIGMYVCGPTVYNYIHIGNARSVVVFDILYRTLKYLYKDSTINYIRNITDIDDKINNRAKELNLSIQQLTARTIQDFNTDLAFLNCLNPTLEPKATEHVEEMISTIEILIDKDIAYRKAGHIYFRVNKLHDYSQLSSRSFDNNIAGTRVEISDIKDNIEDFVLWKPSHQDDDPSSIFDSPWGRGRPGWHIECSAMSHKYLGENFDIHGGGADLIFPHHTNEIAQSTSAFEGSKYARYWLHNGFLTVSGKKMSKSLNNFITVKDVRTSNIEGEVLRLALMQTNYRKPLDYSEKSLNDAKKTLNHFYRAIYCAAVQENLPDEFITHILDDLNINEALASMQKLTTQINNTVSHDKKVILASQLKSCGNFLGILQHKSTEWFHSDSTSSEIEKLLEERLIHKKNKNWAEADQIRDILKKKNIIIEDQEDGSCTFRISL